MTGDTNYVITPVGRHLPVRRVAFGRIHPLERLTSDLPSEPTRDGRHSRPNAGIGRAVVVGGDAASPQSHPFLSAMPCLLGGDVPAEPDHFKTTIVYYQWVIAHSNASVAPLPRCAIMRTCS